MNIFVFDPDPAIAAKMHCDKHVVKMILEYAQIMCTTHRVIDNLPDTDESLYKKTHIIHPCVVWARESKSNYEWLYALFRALGDEYTLRYGKSTQDYRKSLRSP